MKARNTLITAAAATVLAGVTIGGVALGSASAPAPTPTATAADTRPGMGMHGAGMGGMRGMDMAAMTVADEFDYLTTMIPHHEEAIDAAVLLREGTDRPELRAFAETVIDTQTREVERMRGWLAEWYPDRDTTVAYTPMMRDLAGLRGADLDRAFLSDMIPHHMMAVMTSQQMLNQDLATRAEVVPFAQDIRDTQRAEIEQMRDWLAGTES